MCLAGVAFRCDVTPLSPAISTFTAPRSVANTHSFYKGAWTRVMQDIYAAINESSAEERGGGGGKHSSFKKSGLVFFTFEFDFVAFMNCEPCVWRSPRSMKR